MICIITGEAGFPHVDFLKKYFPETEELKYRELSDDDLLKRNADVYVLAHKAAVMHAKTLCMKAGKSRGFRIIAVIPGDSASEPVNARISGADVVLAGECGPDRFAFAVKREFEAVKRGEFARELIRRETVLGNRFELTELIGVGPHSEVFLAKDREKNTLVTVKMLCKKLSLNKPVADSFLCTAQLRMDIHAPTLVDVLDFGKWEDRCYVILGIGRAENLYGLMGSRPVDSGEIIHVAMSIVHALSALKAGKLLHFDVKPENILYWNGLFYLSDFGVLQPFEKALEATGFALWPDSGFAAPEYFPENSSITARSDVWSLGMVLDMMCHHENPYLGRAYTEGLEKRLNQNYLYEVSQNKFLPHHIFIAVNSMTLRRPEARPRLRDLEIIFYLSALNPENRFPKEHLHLFTDSFESAAEESRTEHLELSTIQAPASPNQRQSLPKFREEKRSPLSVWIISHPGMVLTGFCGIVLAVMTFFLGVVYARSDAGKLYFQQGPRQVFTCYNGHTAVIRTLDLRTVCCPECGKETTPSFTCRDCKRVFGKTIWPKRDMDEAECQAFDRKTKVCPYCKSENIIPTPLPPPEKIPAS